MFVDSCRVERQGKRPSEYLPECVGQETELLHTRRTYTDKKTGEQKEASDVKLVIDGRAITERRSD
jgi:hypothetical protein